jgi:hypothetical protein
MPSAAEIPHQVMVKSTTCQVRLMPWDPDSIEHVQRLIDQRIACGWKSELVPQWISPQKEGKIAIQWIVRSILSRDIYLSTHPLLGPLQR